MYLSLNQILIFVLITIAAGNASAQTATRQDTLKELMRRIEILTEEIENKKLGEVAEDKYESKFGMGPAASRIYHLNKPGVSIAGYGEAVYNTFANTREDGAASNAKNKIDFLRQIIYFGFRFNDWILFNSEIEFEHAKTGDGQPGEVAVEFGYIDMQFHRSLNLRSGMVLIPLGIINEFHEPTTFQGSLRPETERYIIPTTWRGIGAGFVGQTPNGIGYKLYITESLNAANFSASGIRSGRQNGAKAVAEDFGISGRLNYAGYPGLDLGGSFFYGNTGQGLLDSNGERISAPLSLFSLQATYEKRQLELRGLLAYSTIGDVEKLNQVLQYEGDQSIGESQFGYYLTAGYDFLPHLASNTSHYLALFVQYEKYNTHNDVPEGYSKNPALARTNISTGFKYKPHPHVAFKFDYIIRKNDAKTAVDQINLAVNYLF